MAYILKQNPWNPPFVSKGLLQQAEDMSDKAGGLATHASPQASTAHVCTGEARGNQLSLLC